MILVGFLAEPAATLSSSVLFFFLERRWGETPDAAWWWAGIKEPMCLMQEDLAAPWLWPLGLEMSLDTVTVVVFFSFSSLSCLQMSQSGHREVAACQAVEKGASWTGPDNLVQITDSAWVAGVLVLRVLPRQCSPNSSEAWCSSLCCLSGEIAGRGQGTKGTGLKCHGVWQWGLSLWFLLVKPWAPLCWPRRLSHWREQERGCWQN